MISSDKFCGYAPWISYADILEDILGGYLPALSAKLIHRTYLDLSCAWKFGALPLCKQYVQIRLRITPGCSLALGRGLCTR
jgi:hypothetical protein